MNHRKLSGYNSASQDFMDAFKIISALKDDIRNLRGDYELSEDEDEQLTYFEKVISDFFEKYGVSSYEIVQQVEKELISPRNVDYATKYKKYPEHASPKYEEMSAAFNQIFDLEDQTANTVIARIWKEEIKNDLSIVHSGNHFINLPGSPRYREGTFDHTSYISCSLLSDNHMDMYLSHLGIEFEYSPNSFLCASRNDCATLESSYPSTLTVGKVGEYYVRAGHSIGNIVATKLLTPKAIERHCIKQAEKLYGGRLGISQNGESTNKTIINETVLNVKATKPKSIFLATSGCEFLFSDYYDAMQMKKQYKVPIKVKNIADCRRKNRLEPYSETEKQIFIDEVKDFMNGGYHALSNMFATMPQEEIKEFFDGYRKDVIPVLDTNLADVQLKAISRLEREVIQNRNKDVNPSQGYGE